MLQCRCISLWILSGVTRFFCLLRFVQMRDKQEMEVVKGSGDNGIACNLAVLA
ncbi:hypothetical protein [Pokkaliibacter plantistimulans]|uniref:hypothetical protein n=1 Tax=Pokkaliibacter plantistimulans TaxID=1635171 RepID=UPI0026C9355F|nr:hypothetical protein [Pokkaliibacter plantistimulans]